MTRIKRKEGMQTPAPMPTPVREGRFVSLAELLDGAPWAFNPNLWLGKEGLQGDEAVKSVCEKFPDAKLTRSNLVALGKEAASEPSNMLAARKLVTATFMWGYGKSGRAYGNARKTLVQHSADLDRSLEVVGQALLDRDVKEAFSAFHAMHPPGYESGFFTKYLYFFGLGSDWPLDRPLPLIWDSRVGGTLGTYERVFGWDAEWPRRLPDRYEFLCASVHAWADELGLRSDQIELFMFDSRHSDATNEALDVAAAAVRLLGGTGDADLEAAIGRLPKELRAELDRRIKS